MGFGFVNALKPKAVECLSNCEVFTGFYEGSFGVLCGCYTVLWGIRASRPETMKAVSIRARAKHLRFNAKSVGEELWVLCSLDPPNTHDNISWYKTPKRLV